jgi:hypothetical protein
MTPPDDPALGPSDEPVRLLETRGSTAPLLRVYLHQTSSGAGGSADDRAAWRRLSTRLDRPTATAARPPRRVATLWSGLAAAGLAVWLLFPSADSRTPSGSPTGGASGSHAALGGTEGKSGVRGETSE